MSSAVEAALAATVRVYVRALRDLASQPGEFLQPDSVTAVLGASLVDLSMAGAVLADLLEGSEVPSGVVAGEINRWLAVAVLAVELATTDPGSARWPS